MRNYLLTSTAMFAPPDVPGADGGGDQIADTSAPDAAIEDAGSATEEHPPAAQTASEDHSKPRVETITESIKRATAETKEKAEAAAKAKTTKAAKAAKDSQQTDGATTGDAAAKTGSETTTDGNTATATQAASGPPKAWNKEEKALWNDLPEAARAAIIRREADTEKGVNELRTRYQDIDTAIAPYKAVMTQNNVTPGQAINQLFKWHMELAGPNKVQAFRDLAQSFGIDPATIAAAPAPEAQAGANPPDNSIPENLRPVITNLETRIKSFEEQNAAAMQNAAKQTWVNWSKDKPHAETVRGFMAQLINGDLALIQAGQPQVSNTIKDGSIDMDAAYQAAIYAHPDVRATLLQEDQTRRDKEAKAAADKARKASVSMRSGAPAGAVNGNQGNAPKVETPRESIMRALAEVRGTQH